MEKQIAVYVRVSSRKQDTQSQEPDLQRWIAAFAADDHVQWYADTFSGRTMDRPGWNSLQRAIDEGRVATVVVWRLDRLGRTAAGLTKLFVDLRNRGINLVSLKDGLDLATPAGRLMANVLASVAEYETEIRAERVHAGLAKAKANGVKLGGSKKGRRISITDDQVESIKRFHAEGMKPAKIARAVGTSRPSVYRLIAETAAVRTAANVN